MFFLIILNYTYFKVGGSNTEFINKTCSVQNETQGVRKKISPIRKELKTVYEENVKRDWKVLK